MANAAVAAVKKGCELYKEIKGATGNVKEVLDDLKKQFLKNPAPTNAEKIQYNEEVLRVQAVAKTDPGDAVSQIGDNLGTFFDALGNIQKLHDEEERKAHEVYKGDESIGKRALQRVLIRSRLDIMYAELREMMVYQTPPELKDLWTRCEKMWTQIVEEQKAAHAEETRRLQAERLHRFRRKNRIKENAVWVGAILFVVAWYAGVLILLRTSHTFLGY